MFAFLLDMDIEAVLPFLEPSARIDVRKAAVDSVLGLTGSTEGLRLVAERLSPALTRLMCDCNDTDAALALINVSSAHPKALLPFTEALWKAAAEPTSEVADPAAMILSNVTIDEENAASAAERIDVVGVVDALVKADKHNAKGAKLHYLGPLLSNLSQSSRVRRKILDDSKCAIQRLLPFTEYAASRVRRGGVIGAVKNCWFELDKHGWLLGDDVDILPRLLAPLAGPTPEDMKPEDVEKLPLDLQYLDDDKTIEEDPDLRKMLLEALLQLCATREGRIRIRSNGAYFILRQLHASEQDKHVRLACENVVDLLIKKEEEISVVNIKDVDVPGDVIQELEDMDKEYLKE